MFLPHGIVPRALGVCRSGQTGQTVNLLAKAYGGSNPSAPTCTARPHRAGCCCFGASLAGLPSASAHLCQPAPQEKLHERVPRIDHEVGLLGRCFRERPLHQRPHPCPGEQHRDHSRVGAA